MMNTFKLSSMPILEFGAGSLKNLNSYLAKYGRNVLLITGSESLERSGRTSKIKESLKKDGFSCCEEKIRGEPTAILIDSIAAEYRSKKIEVVCAIGGGSALDAGKAVAAMLVENDSIRAFLEGVGNKKTSGKTLPVIAVPTTSGTGSEATKNAVISEYGVKGFKSSLRHDNYIPKTAIIDPELTVSCPPFVTACCGLDALSQLIESYFSTQANAFTDALAIDAIARMFKTLPAVCSDLSGDVNLRGEIAYSAFISGFTLANAGLCSVHGLASTVGYRTKAPHGLICGLLLRRWLKLSACFLDEKILREKFMNLVSIVSEKNPSIESFIGFIDKFYDSLKLPGLLKYGLTLEMIPEIAATSGNKNNPYPVSKEERELLLRGVLN